VAEIKNKNVVYTSIYGEKDNIKDPLHISDGWDYICFTDNPNIKSDVWRIEYSESTHKDPVRSAKIFKALPHQYLEDYDISIWIDANFIIKNDVNILLSKAGNLQDQHMLVFQHDQGRNCIYDEAVIIKAHQKDDPSLVDAQMRKYKELGYPEQNGLTANSILIRKHNEADIINLSEMWWSEIEQFSRRDQLSFCYCLWELDTNYMMLRYPNVDIRNNGWFRWLPHNYESQEWS
jgi:hypothetical protein